MNAQPQKTPAPTVTLSPAEYNSLVGAAQLSDLRLVKSDFFLSPEGVESQPTLVHKCEIESSHFDAQQGVLVVFVNAEALGTVGEKGTKRHKTVMSAKCQYIIAYDVIGEPSDLAVDAFAKRVARFAAYPYFRGHFAELTSQAGLLLPPLPVIKERRLIPDVGISDSGVKKIDAPTVGARSAKQKSK